MALPSLTKAEFNDKTQNKTIVCFSATWCGPCRLIKPILEEIADEGKSVFIVDVDEEAKLADDFEIRSVPTMVFVEGGQEYNRLGGVQPKTKILSTLG